MSKKSIVFLKKTRAQLKDRLTEGLGEAAKNGFGGLRVRSKRRIGFLGAIEIF